MRQPGMSEIFRDLTFRLRYGLDQPSRNPYPLMMERIEVNLDKEWLSVADICEYMGVSTFVVTSVLRAGELPAVKFGREWRVARQDFENWINEQRRSGATDPESAPQR